MGYRFGFNGKEKDNEITVNGGDYDFGARIYDGRLGRWLSRDPLANRFPFESPYVNCSDNTLLYKDNDGRKKTITTITTDETTGETEVLIVTVSDELRSVPRIVSIVLCGISIPVVKYDWYDVNETVNIVKRDGKVVSKTTTTFRGAYRTTTADNWAWWADALVDDGSIEDLFKPAGGIVFYSKDGQGQETRRGSGKISVENINKLMAIIQLVNAKGGMQNSVIDLLKQEMDIYDAGTYVYEEIIIPLKKKIGEKVKQDIVIDPNTKKLSKRDSLEGKKGYVYTPLPGEVDKKKKKEVKKSTTPAKTDK
ncbi:MAG: hypothetical protein PSX81_08970 [bacterium]|nr:hypothetical protein [bacterium]